MGLHLQEGAPFCTKLIPVSTLLLISAMLTMIILCFIIEEADSQESLIIQGVKFGVWWSIILLSIYVVLSWSLFFFVNACKILRGWCKPPVIHCTWPANVMKPASLAKPEEMSANFHRSISAFGPCWTMQLEPILEDQVSHTHHTASYETAALPSHSMTLVSPSEPPCKAHDGMAPTDLPFEDLPALEGTTEEACNDLSGTGCCATFWFRDFGLSIWASLCHQRWDFSQWFNSRILTDCWRHCQRSIQHLHWDSCTTPSCTLHWTCSTDSICQAHATFVSKEYSTHCFECTMLKAKVKWGWQCMSGKCFATESACEFLRGQLWSLNIQWLDFWLCAIFFVHVLNAKWLSKLLVAMHYW